MMKSSKVLSNGNWSATSPKLMFLVILASAVVLGMVIGEGRWVYLAALVIAPFVLRWPIQVTLGLFTLLVPFENLTVLGVGDAGRTTILWFVGAATIAALLLNGLVSGRLRRPSRAVWWWGAFLLWAGMTF